MLFNNKEVEINYASVWEEFKNVSAVPRASGNEAGIQNYLIEFAKGLNLKYAQDSAGNVIIYKAASFENEESQTIILQAHMDMVCEKVMDSKHNFSSDPILLNAEDGWVYADGTTLGADNGIGMAMILAILKSSDIPHPNIEALFTVDEERGLTGAFNLDVDLLKGKKLINLDSEDDGYLYVGSAGGSTSEVIFDVKKQRIDGDYVVMNIFIRGLFGGHSGCDIHLGRANSIKLGFLLLRNLADVCDFYLYDISGGSKRNVIPRELNMELYFEPEVYYRFEKKIEKEILKFKKRAKRHHKKSDPDLDIMFNIVEKNNPEGVMVFSKRFSNKIARVILSLPLGPVTWNKEYGVVDSSCNLAVVNHQGDSLFLVFSQRASDEKKLIRLVKRNTNILSKAGGKVVTHSSYPAWKPNINSFFVKEISEIYKKLFHSRPKVTIIHAGLECGVIGSRKKDLEMISLGPQILNVHTPKEKVSIKSVEKTFKFLLKIMEKI
ncbi:MAG: beta-Ala-His dipeptidase [Spirochaetales bacterium]|nr:beta-Ala-His dipeptidase [Spirochaetales bacterium]